MGKKKGQGEITNKLGLAKWFKKNWIGLVVGGFVMTMITAILAAIIGPHLATIWPVSKPVVISAPISDYSIPQVSPSQGGVSSSEMTVKNYKIGDEIDGSATLFNNQSVMTPFIIQAIVPDPDNLRDGYVAAPAEITNWVIFNTGSSILIDPNSKVTVAIIFKIPSDYKTSLPKNWQFDISIEPHITAPSSVDNSSSGVQVNIQTQYLFRWLVSMK